LNYRSNSSTNFLTSTVFRSEFDPSYNFGSANIKYIAHDGCPHNLILN